MISREICARVLQEAVSTGADYAEIFAENTVNHSKTCAKDRNDYRSFAFDLFCNAFAHRGFDFNRFKFKVAGCFIAKKSSDLADEFTEVFGSGFGSSEDGKFVLNKRMVKNERFFHNIRFPLKKYVIKIIVIEFRYNGHFILPRKR